MRDWLYIMYDTPEPELINCAWGAVLARSPKHAVFRIGVTAATAELAREKFYASYAKWRESFLPSPDYQI